ncbi:hypothetical protein [Vibrio sp. 10N.261.55.A7]|uniref:hypothetical protein n=1 Tax=Vibrio sp. 10N.261.55.A7 TaxID=1880851 RepID=UPI000C822C53|nr:hypothetical protein [Vibrio sp. 10N.261.55.A7]PMJ98405.1 hypothetical protein BCU12_21825 [Vibrio sp. 10N.261.55.A7]
MSTNKERRQGKLIERINRAEKENQELKEELAQLRRNQGNTAGAGKKERELLSQIENLEERIKFWMAENKSDRATMEKMEAAFDEVAGNLEAHKKANDHLVQRAQREENKSVALDRELKELIDTKLSKKVWSYIGLAIVAFTSFVVHENAISVKQGTIEKFVTANRGLKVDNNRLRAELNASGKAEVDARLAKELRKYDDDIAQHTATIRTLEARLKTVSQQNSSLIAEANDLKSKLPRNAASGNWVQGADDWILDVNNNYAFNVMTNKLAVKDKDGKWEYDNGTRCYIDGESVTKWKVATTLKQGNRVSCFGYTSTSLAGFTRVHNAVLSRKG